MGDARALVASLDRPLQLVREYEGGQGDTLQVRDRNGESFVLKVLAPGESSAEVAVAASIAHPAIPMIRETGRLPDGRSFLLRDFVDGQPLAALPSDPDELLPILQQLLEVIAFVHLRGVLHLDLKPGNLVLDRDGRLHLLDFGLAVRSGSSSKGGTPFFAAPEILFGGVPDARSDLFSIGAMLVHAQIPSTTFDPAAFARRFPNEDFLSACRIEPADLPPQLLALIQGCIARHPADRLPDAEAALDALTGTASGRPSIAMLAPDPVQMFAAELQSLAEEEHDVRITGGDIHDRQAIAMQLAVSRPGVVAIRHGDGEVLVARNASPERHVDLPPLDAGRLAPHVATALGLEGEGLAQATAWLLQQGTGIADVHGALRALADTGELLPAGARWTWPAARRGRLKEAPPTTRTEATGSLRDRILAACRAGRIEPARALWRNASSDEEHEARLALIDGLLDSGEAAKALPLCAEHPVLRAHALIDTGQYAMAADELSRAGPATTPRHRRVAARLAMARGDHDQAHRHLDHEDNGVAENLVLAALLEQQGELERSRSMLQAALQQFDCEANPYIGASIHTTLGHIERRDGKLDAARDHFETAVRLAQRIGHLRHAASSQLNLGIVSRDDGAHSEAAGRFREAHALYEHLGDQGQAAIAKANLGLTALASNDVATAKKTLKDAADRLQQLGDTGNARLVLLKLALSHVRTGELQAAEAAVALVGAPDTPRLQEEFQQLQQELTARRASSESVGMPEGSNQQPSRELFRTFLSVNRKLAQAEALDHAMSALLDAAVTLTGGRNGYLLIMRSDGIRREFDSGSGSGHARAFSRSLANQSITEQRTLTGADVLANQELQAMQSVQNLRIRSALCAPFHSAGGTRGAIYVEHPGRAGVFSDTDKESLEVLADQAAIAVDRMLREEAMRTELTSSKKALAVASRSARRSPVRLLGDSAAMSALRAEIDKLADLPLSVLILGETGTGKELIARALHERGSRKQGPFVAENCSALPAELMERELFGHVEGAFTGADRDRPGLLELANGGTLFLDEVGDMPASLQVKLLRALQERTIRRIGGDETIELDFRMVAATHKDLRQLIADGAFREDLFFRIAAVELQAPPLRERQGDVELLARHFVAQHAKDATRKLELSPAALQSLSTYSWPGNVRELEHVVARASLLCDGNEITDLRLPRESTSADAPAGSPDTAPAPTPPEVLTLKEAEKRAIEAAMARHQGDKSKAAKSLGVSRTALYDKLKRHGLRD